MLKWVETHRHTNEQTKWKEKWITKWVKTSKKCVYDWSEFRVRTEGWKENLSRSRDSCNFFSSLSLSLSLLSCEEWASVCVALYQFQAIYSQKQHQKMSAAEAKAFQFVFGDVAANFAQEIFHTALTLLWLTNEIMLKVWASHQRKKSFLSVRMVLSLMIRITSQNDAAINLFSTVAHNQTHTHVRMNIRSASECDKQTLEIIH